MIIDILGNADMYYGLAERMERAFQYLRETNLDGLEPGRYEIDGDEIYALIQHFEGLPIESGKWESHRRYIDIQYVYSGVERMGYAYVGGMTVAEAYDGEKDCMFTSGRGSFMDVKCGMFAVFAPDDAHMPCIAANQPGVIKKAVVKVLI